VVRATFRTRLTDCGVTLKRPPDMLVPKVGWGPLGRHRVDSWSRRRRSKGTGRGGGTGELFPLSPLLYPSVSLKVGEPTKNELFVDRYPPSTVGDPAYLHERTYPSFVLVTSVEI